ncbi:MULTISPECIES: hypothetical protein [unclassified Rhodococcus (in: high G+C Gram-positive bacteria)]
MHTSVLLLGSHATVGPVLTRDDIAAELERKGVRFPEHEAAHV